MYTVKQLSDLANVSVRTLHYYDEIGLLHPTQIGANNYRYYDDDALLRLQQILFYREIGLELMQIKDILDSADFDVLAALSSHRGVLQAKIKRLHELVSTVDTTIMHLTGDMDMSKKKLFEPFSEKKQKQYEREARLQYGPELVNESVKRWNSYSKAEKEAIQQEGGQNYLAMAKAMKAGLPVQSAEVQAIVQKWHQHISYFYEPTLEILRGLGGAYKDNSEFRAFFEKIHDDLPEYLSAAIAQYVDDLEYAEIERMLAEDAVKRGNG